MKIMYEIMHGEMLVARIDSSGHCEIYEPDFMPYNLYLEDAGEDIDTLVNNVTNFNYWCATRILTLDRQYAKEILNSIGVPQAVTDKDRAQIALSYRCVSLTDIFWVRIRGEEITFSETNLYENHLSNAFVDVSLRGRQLTVQNRELVTQNSELARDLSTNGCFPKAWIRTERGFQLWKDGGLAAVESELLASKICRCFACEQVAYEENWYEDQKVSVSDIMTSSDYSIVSREAFEIYAVNREIDVQEYILQLDAYSYYMMNILDYLVGNTDRHWGNWGFLVDNTTNRTLRLHPLMDFNQSFRAYDTPEGGNCQTVFSERMSQMEAAVLAVRAVGLNQIKDVDAAWFRGREAEYEMFCTRLEILKGVQSK